MPNPVAVNDLQPISGSLQTSRISYGVETAGKNYGQDYNGTTWYSDIPNNGTFYTIISDNYTANYYISRSNAEGAYVEGGLPAVDEYSAPVFWTTFGTSSLDIITTVNGLPDRVGQLPFNSGAEALNWIASSSNYFAVGPDYYAQIDADNLQLYLDANQVISYPTTQSTWYDLSGYNLKANLVNGLAASWSSSGWFNFDGTDDYGTIPSDSSMNSNVFSVEALVRLGVADNNIRTIASRGGNPGSATNGWWMGTLRNGLGGGQNEFRFMWWGTSTYLDRVTSIGAADLRWHHMIATSDGTTGTVYIDGVSNTSAALPAGNLYTDGDAYLIGIADTLGNPWSGSIAQERFYPKSLTAADVAQNYYGGPIVTDGLIYALDAGNLVSYPKTGTTAYPLTGSNNGTLTNGVGFSANDGGYFMFDGTDDYINVSGLSSAFQISQGSIEAWIKPSSDGTDQMVCGLGGGNTLGATRVIRINGSQWGYVGYGSANQDWSSITPVTFNTWAHVVIGWNGTALTFWLNGTRYDVVRSGIVTPNSSVIRLGVSTWSTGDRPFEGDIATFRMYSKLLSNAEVLQNYNATK